MALVRQSEYARRRGVTREAIRKRTTTAGGPIPVYGVKKLIDTVEADALWHTTMSAQGMANARAGGAARAEGPPPAVSGAQLSAARAAALVVDVQTKRLMLEQRRGALISRDAATLKAFAFARVLRDSWLSWPARIGPQIAAQFDLDAATVVVTLERHVRAQLEELASERTEF
jgi:hypothetical protein